jgi:excisionase family DNA binding protein
MVGTKRAGEWMSIKTAAEYLDCSQRQVYRLLSRGDVPAFKVGRLTRIRRVDLDRAVLAQPRDGATAIPTPPGRTPRRTRRSQPNGQLRLLDGDTA